MNLIIAELQLGLVQYDWTILFQIMNSVLWILIIVVIFSYLKKSKNKRKQLEERVTKLEWQVEELKKK